VDRSIDHDYARVRVSRPNGDFALVGNQEFAPSPVVAEGPHNPSHEVHCMVGSSRTVIHVENNHAGIPMLGHNPLAQEVAIGA
jgi:hypothetical protein